MISVCITFAYGSFIFPLRIWMRVFLNLPIFCEKEQEYQIYHSQKCIDRKFKNQLNIVYKIDRNNLYFLTRHYHFWQN